MEAKTKKKLLFSRQKVTLEKLNHIIAKFSLSIRILDWSVEFDITLKKLIDKSFICLKNINYINNNDII